MSANWLIKTFVLTDDEAVRVRRMAWRMDATMLGFSAIAILATLIALALGATLEFFRRALSVGVLSCLTLLAWHAVSAGVPILLARIEKDEATAFPVSPLVSKKESVNER